jgi:hypothetical protein
MMRASLALMAAALTAAIPAAAQDGPSALELTEQGYLHCSHPNVRAKTCRSIDVYELMQEGVYGQTSLIAVGSGITLEVFTPVWRVEDAHCGTLREQDLMTGTLRVGVREVAPHIAAQALEQARRQMAGMLDQEYCVRYEPAGSEFIARVTVAGERRPEYDTRIKMITGSDGYRVAR